MKPAGPKLPSYGGQALIEGILMRGSRGVAAAMRTPDGKIIIQTEPLKGIYQSKIKSIPFLRGLIMLWDSLGLGMRYLTISANIQTNENEKIEGPALYATLALSIALAVGLFFVTPALVSQGLEIWLGWNAWVSNLLEGILRLGLIIGYIWAVGKIPEIKRVFIYHGAEHKTINAFERGVPLTPESVSTQSTEHPRCGTSFLLTLAVISILLFSILGPLPFIWRTLSRIILIPVLAGIAYEYIRWAADHLGNPFVRWLIKPNLALQRLTTGEPGLLELETSIAAFQAMISLEESIKNREIVTSVPQNPQPSSLTNTGFQDMRS